MVVVVILEGRNFDLNSQIKSPTEETACLSSTHSILFEARFLDDVLESDPIPFKSPCPSVFAELAWEVSRKSLHDFRIERKPIKLQAFALGCSGCKHLIGYSVFDIRSAQESPQPKYEWKPLLNPQYKGISTDRPEVLCALRLLRSEDDPLMKHVSGGVVTSNGNGLSSSRGDLRLDSDLRMKEVEGMIRLWECKKNREDDCSQLYELSFIVASARHLDKLRPRRIPDVEDYFFSYSVLGTAIQTKTFQDLISCEFPIEKISFKLAVPSIEVIESYLSMNPSMEIQFNRVHRRTKKTETLAYSNIPLRKLVLNGIINPLTTESNLCSCDESVLLHDPQPRVGVCIDLVPLSPSHESSSNNSLASLTPANRVMDNAYRHYNMCIDIRTLESFILCGSFFIQYIYPVFGSIQVTQTNSVSLPTPKGQHVMFKEGVMSFNFPSSMSKMVRVFAKLPLLMELVEETPTGKHIIRGITRINLSDVINQTPDLEKKRILVMNSTFEDASNVEIARLNVIFCLQERDSLNISDSFIPSTYGGKDKNNKQPSPTENASDVLQQLLVEAAVEVEVWKQQQKKKMKEQLNLLQNDSSKWPRRLGCVKDDERNINNNNNNHFDLKVLEQELLESLAQVREQEDRLNEKKKDLDRLEVQYKERFEKLNDEIAAAIEEVRNVYEGKLSREKRTVMMLEEENKKLRDQISPPQINRNGSTRLSFRSQSLVRTGSVPSSARSVSRP